MAQPEVVMYGNRRLLAAIVACMGMGGKSQL